MSAGSLGFSGFWGLGFRVLGDLGLGFWCLGLGVQGLGLGGLGFRAAALTSRIGFLYRRGSFGH